MAYPMSNTDKLSYVQMQTLAKVRSTHGYHLIITNPFLSKQESAGGEVTVCKLPRGLTLGTTQTFLFYFPNLTGSAMIKYRIRNDDGETGDTKGAYMEILPTRDGMTFYQYSSAIGIKPKTIFSGSAEFTQFALVQLEAASNGYTKLFYNGVYKNTADALNFGAHFVQHTIDKTFNPLMVMEIHHTYISDNSKIFNTSVDFKKPELPLSPGAYILWEGSSNGPFTVKYNNVTIFSSSKAGTGLRLLMKMFTIIVLVGFEEDALTSVKNPKLTGQTTNLIHPLILSSNFKLTNFHMETGSR
ncbi:uncharacterized protein LOC135393521 isoform X2 [Ornithodoros turicata]|uniref:uncharacterized protein LOC135393521 isoform X2 n=1 Tax=Ornithodoros turicata TaxID=34597 RepID=UPI003138F461